ncbi:LysR family transcriptional regulator [Paracidovorax anthurii]|uniref:LysR family transcriptional regulator n=1 Tax=Paracidovorax anthurii TaxID=78229 RepID=A0A328ZKG8_9BURK|nr:LysR family transcriptional regulator [Paracidovorax anthurii]RAR85142.1 LysR family transcriptional regulator [Paracidovorax anthurii]
MDFRQIQYFLALFEDGSVTQAARRLGIVQPTLSMQIARLEEELGQQLFERKRQGMSPTAAGRHMYRLFSPIARDFTSARAELLQRSEAVTGRVSLGLLSSLAESVLPDALSRFSDAYPHVEVMIAVGYSTSLIDWVSNGQVDAAIINLPRARLSLAVEPLAEEDMLLVTGSACGPLLPPSIRLARLPDLELDLILPTRRHGLRGVLDTAAQQEGITLAPKYEVDVLGTIVRLVESTRFATVLPRIVVQRAVNEGTLRVCPIQSPRIVRQVVRVSDPQRPLGTAAHALIDAVADEIRRVLGVAA